MGCDSHVGSIFCSPARGLAQTIEAVRENVAYRAHSIGHRNRDRQYYSRFAC